VRAASAIGVAKPLLACVTVDQIGGLIRGQYLSPVIEAQFFSRNVQHAADTVTAVRRAAVDGRILLERDKAPWFRGDRGELSDKDDSAGEVTQQVVAWVDPRSGGVLVARIDRAMVNALPERYTGDSEQHSQSDCCDSGERRLSPQAE